jgi:hypothetical protein
MNTYLHNPHRSLCFTALNLPTVLSPTTRCRPRNPVCFWFEAYRTHASLGIACVPAPVGRIVTWASPFTRRLATATGRIEFVTYGPVVHLRMLSTPPRGDAVTFGYNAQTKH